MPLDPIEEAKFEKLKASCRELCVPAPPEIYINFVVRDKDGNIINDDTQRGHSWTRNFYNWQFSQLTQTVTTGEDDFRAGVITSKDTNGNNRFVAGCGAGMAGRDIYFTGSYGYNDLVGSSLAGIVVGTSNASFSANDHALGALIVSGTGVGQLWYSSQELPIPTYAAKKWTATMSRTIENKSGADITIRETGLYWRTVLTSNATFFSLTSSGWMTERNVLAPEFLLPDGAQVTVSYKTSMDYSVID